MSVALNYVLYQVGWLACVFGAAWSYPWAGSALGAVTLATHVVLAERRLEELRLACLVGIIGATQAAEALKLLAGVGTSLAGRLQMLDARRMRWDEIRIPRQPGCPVCGTAH